MFCGLTAFNSGKQIVVGSSVVVPKGDVDEFKEEGEHEYVYAERWRRRIR
jgi:hypothetical protein